jgi:hypothetical protein
MCGIARTLSGTSESHETVGGEFEGDGAGGVQIDVIHQTLARVIGAYVDGVAAVVVGVKLARF